MGRELPLGRIAGIRIGMDWSVPIIALLYTWILATDRFPYEQPGLSDTAYWLAGIAGALLFFASLLAHEVGHAVVARREGIGVHRISLWLLGGLTHLESNAETPKAEIRIAAIGPLTSAAVGVLCIGVDWLVADTGTAGLLGHVFAWVGFLNLLLAAFNMIPASPLDGGKVLAGIIWSRTGSATGATVTAARVGMVAGAAMATYGIFNLDGGGFGFWLVIVGVFIFSRRSAGGGERAGHRLARGRHRRPGDARPAAAGPRRHARRPVPPHHVARPAAPGVPGRRPHRHGRRHAHRRRDPGRPAPVVAHAAGP